MQLHHVAGLERVAGWLAYWKNDVGQWGFYPFDLAAAAYVLHPGSVDCATVEARVAADEAIWTSWVYSPTALLASVGSLPRREGAVQANVTYCPHAQLGLKQALISEWLKAHALTRLHRAADEARVGSVWQLLNER